MKFPSDPEVLSRIGIRYYEGKQWNRAMSRSSASFRLKPSFTAAVYLGLTNEATGRFDDAESYYRAAGSLSIDAHAAARARPSPRRPRPEPAPLRSAPGDRPGIDPHRDRTGARHHRRDALGLCRLR